MHSEASHKSHIASRCSALSARVRPQSDRLRRWTPLVVCVAGPSGNCHMDDFPFGAGSVCKVMCLANLGTGLLPNTIAPRHDYRTGADCAGSCVQVIDTTQKFAGQSQERGALSLLMTATEPSLAGKHRMHAMTLLSMHCSMLIMCPPPYVRLPL